MVGHADDRTPSRKALDEQIASEPKRAPLNLSPDARAEPVEVHLARRARRPVALNGIVENGLVRLLDPTVKLPEHARVIVVATE